MIKKFKNMPFSVKMSIVFLLMSYIAMCFTAPALAITLGFFLGVIYSIARLIQYYVSEE